MAVRSGVGAQLAVGAEVTYGTYVAPSRTLEFVSEGLVRNEERINSAGIRRGATVRRTGRWAVNSKGGGGPLQFELASKGMGLLWKHALGSSTITTPGGATLARRHRCVMGDLDDLSLVIQKALPKNTDGSLQAYSFLGSVITDWELSVDVDGLVMLSMGVDSQFVDPAPAAVTAAFPANDRLFSYQQTAITLDAAALHATTLSIRMANALATSRYFIRQSNLKKRPIVAGEQEISGSFTVEFETTAEVNYFLNAAPGAEIPLLTNVKGALIDGTTYEGLDVNCPKIRLDGELPTVQGPEIITVTCPFVVLDDSSAEPITVDYYTTDTAA